MRKVMLNGKKGTPCWEIIVGSGNSGAYKVEVWDSKGEEKLYEREGINWDDVIDKFPLVESAKDLMDCSAVWVIDVFGETRTYSVTVKITQDGKPVENGAITYSGKLDQVVRIRDIVEFVVD